MNSTTTSMPTPVAAPIQWILTETLNCSGRICPPNTVCMRPEPYGVPMYCVHQQAAGNVPEFLAKWPALVYYEDIGLAVVAYFLALIFLVQVGGGQFLFFDHNFPICKV